MPIQGWAKIIRSIPKQNEFPIIYFIFSIAAIKRDLFEEARHLCSRVILVFTNEAMTEFSSTISFGSNKRLKFKEIVGTLAQKKFM